MTKQLIRVAALQMNSGADVAANLAAADELLRRATDDGCQVAVLPENFALMPARGRDKNAAAEDEGDGPIQAFLAETARRNDLWIVGGSIPLKSPDPERVFGASPVYRADGSLAAMYRKIHLFDVDLAGTGESYRESNSMFAGDESCVVDTPAGTLGMSICYDLRFAEMYRLLLDKGATWFSVPAAFTAVTGKAHWHVLNRARAIENLSYVVAPGQFGMHPDGRSTYGHSLIVDPWGRLLAEATDEVGFVAADVDVAAQQKLRQEFPALSNRRLALNSGVQLD